MLFVSAEIFLHLLGRYGGAGEDAANFRGVPADLVASASAADGDGMAAPRCEVVCFKALIFPLLTVAVLVAGRRRQVVS